MIIHASAGRSPAAHVWCGVCGSMAMIDPTCTGASSSTRAAGAAAAPEEVVGHRALERREKLLAVVEHEVVFDPRQEPHLQDRIRRFPERRRVEVLVADAVALLDVGPPRGAADLDDGVQAGRRHDRAQRALGGVAALREIDVGQPAERPRLRGARLRFRRRPQGFPRGRRRAPGGAALDGHGADSVTSPESRVAQFNVRQTLFLKLTGGDVIVAPGQAQVDADKTSNAEAAAIAETIASKSSASSALIVLFGNLSRIVNR